jgi:hypothetical protein
MAKKRGRPRKKQPRTKSGRLSRAYKSVELRDYGTAKYVAKRAAIINGADPQLAATASGILLANGLLTKDQHLAAQRYAWAHSLTYGRPWKQICPLGEPVGNIPTDEQWRKGAWACDADRLAHLPAVGTSSAVR